MTIPGVLSVAVVAALSAFLQSLASGLSMLEFSWVPVAVTLLGVLLKWWDVFRQAQEPGAVLGVRGIENDSKLRRFLLG